MKIILADDHDLVRETLKYFLERIDSDCEVIEAGNFSDALAAADTTDHADLIILDLRMPGMNRFGGLDTMCQRHPEIPTAIISGFMRREDVIEAIQHGAAGVIPKSLSSKAMLGALRVILAGETFVPAMVAEDESLAMADGPPPDSSETGPIRKLTSRERDVLHLLIPGNTNKEIGRRLGIQEVTVKLHLRGIFRKFNVTNRTQAVRAAIQNGWPLQELATNRVGPRAAAVNAGG